MQMKRHRIREAHNCSLFLGVERGEIMKKITPDMMAEAMGTTAQTIRAGLRQGIFNFGVAMKQSGTQHTYIIFPEKAREIVGTEKLREWGY